MATLYVENVPDDLYEALRKRARSQRRSIAAEVLELLRQNVPTKSVLKQRRAFMPQAGLAARILRTARRKLSFH